MPGSRFPVEWHFPLGFLTDRPSSSSPAAANPNPSCLSASSIPKRSQVEQVELGLQPTEPSHQAACHSSTPFRAPLFEFLDSLFPPVLICLYLSLHPASIPLSLACPSVRERGPPSVSAFKIWTSPVFFHDYKSSAVLLNSISLHKCTFLRLQLPFLKLERLLPILNVCILSMAADVLPLFSYLLANVSDFTTGKGIATKSLNF